MTVISKASLTPEEVRPFPKAGPRHEHRGMIMTKSLILTNTPEKNKIKQKNGKRNEQRNPPLFFVCLLIRCSVHSDTLSCSFTT
jgi:hypothetical protein